MKTLTVHRANDDRATPIIIEIISRLPPAITYSLAPIMCADAAALAKALRAALPGGTLDRLTAELLQQSASDLIRSYANDEPMVEVAP